MFKSNSLLNFYINHSFTDSYSTNSLYEYLLRKSLVISKIIINYSL